MDPHSADVHLTAQACVCVRVRARVCVCVHVCACVRCCVSDMQVIHTQLIWVQFVTVCVSGTLMMSSTTNVMFMRLKNWSLPVWQEAEER